MQIEDQPFLCVPVPAGPGCRRRFLRKNEFKLQSIKLQSYKLALPSKYDYAFRVLGITRRLSVALQLGNARLFQAWHEAAFPSSPPRFNKLEHAPPPVALASAVRPIASLRQPLARRVRNRDG